MNRREQRIARRADASGSGPTLEERPPARFPGVTGAFALFGEVLLVGVLVLAAGILVVTLPAALAAGIRHLRRYLAAEGSPARLFWGDVRKALPGGVGVGAAALALVLLLTLDIDLANSGALPGGVVIAAVGWVGLAATGVTLLAAAGAWTPDRRGWRSALRGVPGALRDDPVGGLYLTATVGFVGVVTWALPPLLIPALGCAALAVIAIPERRRHAR